MSVSAQPPFRADHVGSLLRPPALHELREKVRQGKAGAAELKAAEDQAIREAVRLQEELGLQSITDGEFRRSWWHLDFLWGLDGVERGVGLHDVAPVDDDVGDSVAVEVSKRGRADRLPSAAVPRASRPAPPRGRPSRPARPQARWRTHARRGSNAARRSAPTTAPADN